MPLLDLLQVQAGTEPTWGTGVTATVKLMGVEDCAINPGVSGKTFHDLRGSLARGHLAALTGVMPEGKLDVLATYDDAPYYLDNLCGQASPSGSGPYTRNYTAPTTAVPSPRILTLLYGDATDCSQLAGGLISKFTAKGESGDAMRFSMDLMGKEESAGTLAALSDRSVTLAMGNHVAVYIDTWAGTIGSTQLSGAAFAYELMIDPKRKGDQYLGALTAGNYHEDDGAEGWDGELKLSIELNSASRSLLTALRSSSTLCQRQIRIKATSGTSIIQFDYAGTCEETPELFANRNGVVFFEAIFKPTYNSTLGNWFKAQSVNSVSTLA